MVCLPVGWPCVWLFLYCSYGSSAVTWHYVVSSVILMQSIVFWNGAGMYSVCHLLVRFTCMSVSGVDCTNWYLTLPCMKTHSVSFKKCLTSSPCATYNLKPVKFTQATKLHEKRTLSDGQVCVEVQGTLNWISMGVMADMIYHWNVRYRSKGQHCMRQLEVDMKM